MTNSFHWARPKGTYKGKPYDWSPVEIIGAGDKAELYQIGDECGNDLDGYDIGDEIVVPTKYTEQAND